MQSNRYTNVAIVLHWAIAILILGQVAGGVYMHNLPNSAPAKFDLYQLHKSFGVTVLLLSLARLGWRFGHPSPALPDAMAAWEKLGARAAHIGFYVLMVATPLAGLAIVSASPLDIPTKLFGFIPVPHLPLGQSEAAVELFEEVHEVLAFSILFLLALHVGAALKHQFVNKDHVLQSMAPTKRANWLGIGSVFGVLMLGVVLYNFAPPLVANNATEKEPATEEVGAVSANWVVDYEKSSLRFVGEEKGDAFNGAFSDFKADIYFLPDDLSASKIAVTVRTASAATGDDLRDTTIPGKEWFDTGAHPAATFVSDSIRETGAGAYEASGVLSIKDYEKPVTLLFTLNIDGDQALADGAAELIRTDFGLGEGAGWLDDEGVALNVRVEFSIYATAQ